MPKLLTWGIDIDERDAPPSKTLKMWEGPALPQVKRKHRMFERKM